jgi:aminopeptidase N
MTDAAHALALLSGIDCPERDAALQHFYDKWHKDHLVIDTWFAAQAQSPLASTLDTVTRLAEHPAFKITTPNKVRALIGSFALSNPLQFNRPDGGGYNFLAAKVLEIDRLNPQVAARLLGAFRSYKGLEPKRRAKARAALEKVGGTEGLSRDASEIAGRMLES